MVYQRGNQRDGSPHYVLLYSDDENSGDDDNIPLRSCRKTASVPRKVEVINVQLKSDDTLQALAVRYSCTISELKRINKIHKENEIHARRFMKVPVQPFSLLTETLEPSQTENNGPNEVSILTPEGEAFIKTETSENPVKTPIVTQAPTSEINTIILNSVCEPLASYNSNNSLEIPSSEHDQLISSTDTNTINNHLTDTFKCSGDDCGLSWTQLLAFSLLLGFAGPIIYILYIAEFSLKSHSVASN